MKIWEKKPVGTYLELLQEILVIKYLEVHQVTTFPFQGRIISFLSHFFYEIYLFNLGQVNEFLDLSLLTLELPPRKSGLVPSIYYLKILFQVGIPGIHACPTVSHSKSINIPDKFLGCVFETHKLWVSLKWITFQIQHFLLWIVHSTWTTTINPILSTISIIFRT